MERNIKQLFKIDGEHRAGCKENKEYRNFTRAPCFAMCEYTVYTPSYTLFECWQPSQRAESGARVHAIWIPIVWAILGNKWLRLGWTRCEPVGKIPPSRSRLSAARFLTLWHIALVRSIQAEHRIRSAFSIHCNHAHNKYTSSIFRQTCLQGNRSEQKIYIFRLIVLFHNIYLPTRLYHICVTLLYNIAYCLNIYTG